MPPKKKKTSCENNSQIFLSLKKKKNKIKLSNCSQKRKKNCYVHGGWKIMERK